jgi:magnesium transporter
MSETNRLTPWETLHELAESDDSNSIKALLAELEPSETLRAFLRLNEADQQHVVELIGPELAAHLLDDVPEAYAADLLEQLDAGVAADIVEALPSDQGADLIAEMDEPEAAAVLREMEPEEADEVRDLISYSTGVAGSLMGTEQYAYPDNSLRSDFLADLETRRESVERLPRRLILLDDKNRPTGAVDLVDVLLARPDTALSSLSSDVPCVDVDATLDDLEEFFDRHETQGAPVIDHNGRLVGRLRRQAVSEEVARQAQADQLKVQGIVGEELRMMPVRTRAQRRLAWLSINIVLNIIAASVIAFYQDTISAVIALAVFLPIVSDMSGCSGNQAVAVSLRELTLGIVEPEDVWRVWLQEVAVGVLNGIALGLLIAGAAWLWNGNPWLGAVVGSALGLNTVIAVSIGGTVPLLLKRFGADPAVASGPVLTTITDMCGFFLVLGLATLALPLLT